MNARTNAEKEWLRKLTAGKVEVKEEKVASQKAAAQTEVKEPLGVLHLPVLNKTCVTCRHISELFCGRGRD